MTPAATGPVTGPVTGPGRVVAARLAPGAQPAGSTDGTWLTWSQVKR